MHRISRLPWCASLLGPLVSLFTLAGCAPLHTPAPPAVASAALAGAELGVLVSAGALLLPAPSAAPPAASSATAPTPVAATPTAAHVASPRRPLIFIDPGHGGSDSGAVHMDAAGHVDLLEKDLNLDVARQLAALLAEAGDRVQMARTADTFAGAAASSRADLQNRIDLANAAGADLYVAVHHNGQEDSSFRGTEVYYCSDRPFSDESLRLATLVQQAIVASLRQAGYAAVDRGVKDDILRDHLAVLGPSNLPRASSMPGIIGEALFLTNSADAAALKRADIRQAIARGYFLGIQAYLSQEEAPPSAPSS